jgi:hypothetical protein
MQFIFGSPQDERPVFLKATRERVLSADIQVEPYSMSIEAHPNEGYAYEGGSEEKARILTYNFEIQGGKAKLRRIIPNYKRDKRAK